jgi:MFS family permease
MFSSAAAMLALSLGHGVPALMALTLLAGLCTELYRPAASALVADLCPPEQRVTAAALYRVAINLGFAAGPVCAGLLVKGSFFLLFAGDAATSVLFGVIALVALPVGMRHSAPAEPEKKHWLKTALADRRFVRFLVASLAVTTVTLQMDSTLALHIVRAGHSPTTYGALASINGLVIVLFEVALTVVTERLPARWVMAAGYLLSGIGYSLTALAFSKFAIGLTIVMWTFGEMISSPVASAYVANLAPLNLRGRYMGLWTATWSLALILGPSAGTMLFASNETLLWLLCGVLGAVAALLVLI